MRNPHLSQDRDETANPVLRDVIIAHNKTILFELRAIGVLHPPPLKV